MGPRSAIESGTRLTLALALSACTVDNRSLPPTLPTTPTASSASATTDIDVGEILEPIASSTPSDLPLTPTPLPTLEIDDSIWGTDYTPTPTPELTNPLRGHVFNQRCQVLDESANGGVVGFDCVESWAERPLPGGCANRYRNNLGSPSCNASATSFVINYLADPTVIQSRIGKPGITPDVLVWDVYPYLPPGARIIMDCIGAGVPTIRGALAYFGLEYREVVLSEYTVASVYKSLAPDELLMLAIIGTNAKGHTFQHYTVVSGLAQFDNHETVKLYDSYFYKDPNHPVRDAVLLEESPNIQDDPTRYTGKAYDIVGAMIIRRSSGSPTIDTTSSNQLPPQLPADTDPRFSQLPDTFDESLLSSSSPTPIGPQRYRRQVNYAGEESFYTYYYDPHTRGEYYQPGEVYLYHWGEYFIPLYEQDDPRWGATRLSIRNPYTGQYEQFVRRGCGPTILASLLSIYHESTIDPTLIDPGTVLEKYLPDFDGSGMFASNQIEILKTQGFTIHSLPISLPAITRAISDSQLVVAQVKVNPHWWGDNSWIDHFVLILGETPDGELLIHDPYWGPYVTHSTDLDLTLSTGIFTITPPPR